MIFSPILQELRRLLSTIVFLSQLRFGEFSLLKCLRETCAFHGTRGCEVTSATPGRILKGRNRNVHESIPAAVRRWLSRRVPWNKNRTPGQKPTMMTAVLRIPVEVVEVANARRVCPKELYPRRRREVYWCRERPGKSSLGITFFGPNMRSIVVVVVQLAASIMESYTRPCFSREESRFHMMRDHAKVVLFCTC